MGIGVNVQLKQQSEAENPMRWHAEKTDMEYHPCSRPINHVVDQPKRWQATHNNNNQHPQNQML